MLRRLAARHAVLILLAALMLHVAPAKPTPCLACQHPSLCCPPTPALTEQAHPLPNKRTIIKCCMWAVTERKALEHACSNFLVRSASLSTSWEFLSRLGHIQGTQAHVSQVNRSPVEQQPLCTSSALRSHTNPWLSVSSHLRTAGAAGQGHTRRLQAARAQLQGVCSPALHRVVAGAQPLPALPLRFKAGHVPASAWPRRSYHSCQKHCDTSEVLCAPPQQLPGAAALAASPQCIATSRCAAECQEKKQQRQRMGPGRSWRESPQAPAHLALPLLPLLVSREDPRDTRVSQGSSPEHCGLPGSQRAPRTPPSAHSLRSPPM